MDMEKNVSGKTIRTLIISPPSLYGAGESSPCSAWTVSYHIIRMLANSLPQLCTLPVLAAILAAEPGQNLKDLCLFCYLELGSSVGHDHQRNQHH
jgi:hypothetical protein